MDLDKLSQSEKIIAASALALLVFSFFPWFGLGGGSVNAWDSIITSIAVLLALVMLAQIAVAKFTTTRLPDLPVTWGQVHLILGIAILALIVIKLIIGHEVGALGVTVDLDRKIGIFLGLLAGLGLAYGGYLRSREADTLPGGAAGPGTSLP